MNIFAILLWNSYNFGLLVDFLDCLATHIHLFQAISLHLHISDIIMATLFIPTH